ncbi:MAG: CARDB domain-containing protein, partial [Halobacteria archaeon]|nr:CARDB domain-containing protein [Halobacteria archaeon]
MALLSRRTFLRSVISCIGIGVLGRLSTSRVRAQQEPTEIRLGGETDGWQGRSPESIAGETNPTLNLTAGQRYRVVWENVDGAPHNFVIRDKQGNEMRRTQIITSGTQTVEFTAKEEMGRYHCEVHPESMTGDIRVKAPQEPSFSITETQIDKTNVSPGESVTVSVTVENSGNASGSLTLKLSINNEVVDSRDVSLSAGESRTVTFTRTFDQPGTYDLSINGNEIDTVTVQEDPEPSLSITETS